MSSPPIRDLFPDIVERTQDRLLARARRIIGDLHESADLVNEGYLRLWTALRNGQELASPEGWLWLTVTRLALDARRRRRRIVLGTDPDAVADAGADPAEKTARDMDISYLLGMAKTACGEMAVAIFMQMKGYGISAAEVAHSLGITRRQAYHAAETVRDYLRCLGW